MSPLLPLVLSLLGCEYGATLPSDSPVAGGQPVQAGQTLPIRTRRSILPGAVTGPAPPDAGITRAQCNDMTDGGGIIDGTCVTGVLECNTTIVGHTRGGIEAYSTRFYESKFCTPATTNHDSGDERVYVLELPEDRMRAIVTLDTPCADLDLAALKYNSDFCPSDGSNVNQCEMNRKNGTAREQVDLFNEHPTKWYVIVEGVTDQEGAFALTVQCEKW